VVIFSVLALLAVVAAWGCTCAPRLRHYGALVLIAVLPLVAAVLLVTIGSATPVTILAAVAVGVDLLALADRLRYLDKAIFHLDLEHWWDDFEREFRGYVKANSARNRR
jgi:hypothetical protein